MAKLTTLKVGENKVPIVFSIRAELSVFLLRQLNLLTIEYNFLCHKNYAAVINMVIRGGQKNKKFDSKLALCVFPFPMLH